LHEGGLASPIKEVQIVPAESTEDHYRGMMTRALWAWIPAARTPAAHLRHGATLEVDLGPNPTRARLAFAEDDGRQIAVELDGTHAWLPRKVTARKDDLVTLDLEVTGYQQADGRCLPHTGRARSVLVREGNTYTTETTFEITRLTLNDFEDRGRFGQPPLPDGARIVDVIARRRTWAGGKPPASAAPVGGTTGSPKPSLDGLVEIATPPPPPTPAWSWEVAAPLTVAAGAFALAAWKRFVR
jgi:hypothetical protein